MRQIHAEESAVIAAPATAIYAIIADYRQGHPRILPKEHFSDLRVEQGGVGAGTIIAFKVRLGGAIREARDAVETPEPGRTLIERAIGGDGHITTFTLTPEGDGQQTRVTIATEYPAAGGLRGALEARLVPGMLRGVYIKELKLLAQVMQETTPTK